MRINKFIASSTGLSRRTADAAIANGRVTVNGLSPTSGQDVQPTDKVTLDSRVLVAPTKHTTILLNKPVGYVVSREGQGSKTIYELLPTEFHTLKPVGRLDKDSSGLLLMTDDGNLANELTHPSHQKAKIYQVELNKPLTEEDREAIVQGVTLTDGLSALQLSGNGKRWTVTMSEGRNRQIRRTFSKRNYDVTSLHRTNFGPYKLDRLGIAKYTVL